MVVMLSAFSWKSAGSQYAAFSQHTRLLPEFCF